MKKFLCILLALVCVLSLSSCKSKSKDEGTTQPTVGGEVNINTQNPGVVVDTNGDEVKVQSLKCRYQFSGEKAATLTGKKAAALYNFFVENVPAPSEGKFNTSGQKNVFLSFQMVNDADSTDREFIGAYTVCENGYVLFSPADEPNKIVYYQFPTATYAEIEKVIKGE